MPCIERWIKLELPLLVERKVELIPRFIVGPTPHPELAASACEGVVQEAGYENAVVLRSVTPFRNW